MTPKHKVLKEMYEAFNARDIERALSGMHEDVVWANGMEGEMFMVEAAFASTGTASGK